MKFWLQVRNDLKRFHVDSSFYQTLANAIAASWFQSKTIRI